jgi:hypothetical protein
LNKFTSTAMQVIEVWRQLDPKQNRLIKLKTQAAAKQLRKEINAERGQIRFRNRGNLNSGTLAREIFAMELRKINDWATQYYSICCEVWELRGHKKSAALVRTIHTHLLRKLIAARKSSVAHEAQRSACAMGRFHIARLRIESFKRSADQLGRDWAEKIEIEALELEARARLEKSSDQASFLSRMREAGKAGTESAPQAEARSLPVRSSVPLSEFEASVGKLMVEARRMCSTKYLPRTEIVKIAVLLDEQKLPVRSNLEREAGQKLAEYNQRHSNAAIKSWSTASSNSQFRRVVRKRFSRAEEKYKKAQLSADVVSRGTSRTVI